MKGVRWLVSVPIVVCLLVVGGFWYVFMSPFGYHPPQRPVIDSRVDAQDVFVYGTLRYDWLRWIIMGTSRSIRDGELPGYRKQGLDILPSDDASVMGEVLTVSPEALRALDRYERLGVRYRRESVKLADGSIAWVYQRIEQE